MAFGEKISKQFVDALEDGHDSRAAVNLHNNEAGRLVRHAFTISGVTLLSPFYVLCSQIQTFIAIPGEDVLEAKTTPCLLPVAFTHVFKYKKKNVVQV